MPRRYLDGLVGAWPQEKAIYDARAPINAVDRLACPILLLQGDEDKIVPPSQAEVMHKALLAKGGGPFFLGARASFADVGVFEAIDCLQDLFGAAKLEEVTAGFPLLRAHYTVTKALGRLKVWCEERPKVFLPPPEYAAAVNTTLGR